MIERTSIGVGVRTEVTSTRDHVDLGVGQQLSPSHLSARATVVLTPCSPYIASTGTVDPVRASTAACHGGRPARRASPSPPRRRAVRVDAGSRSQRSSPISRRMNRSAASSGSSSPRHRLGRRPSPRPPRPARRAASRTSRHHRRCRDGGRRWPGRRCRRSCGRRATTIDRVDGAAPITVTRSATWPSIANGPSWGDDRPYPRRS